MMHNTLLASLLIPCIFFTPIPVQENDESKYLPSVNYWEITLDVVMRPDLALSLEISPSQLREIKEMRSRDDLGKIIEAKARQLAERGPISRHVAFSAVDNVVHTELSKILQPEQIQMLKVVKMRSKFATGYSPFSDPEVLAVCALSKDERRRLAMKADDAVHVYQLELDQSIEMRVRKIVDTLRLDSQRQLVLCVGNEYLPGIPIGKDGSLETIPFPPFVKSLGTINLICSHKPFQESAGIHADQLDQLKAINAKCDFHNFFNQSKYKSMPEFANAMLEEGFEELSKVLTKDQLLCAARTQAAAEFANNPVAALSRDKLIAFLMLTEKEAESAREVALSETQRHDALVRKLNQTTFEEIRLSLPEAAQRNLQVVFSGVWE